MGVPLVRMPPQPPQEDLLSRVGRMGQLRNLIGQRDVQQARIQSEQARLQGLEQQNQIRAQEMQETKDVQDFYERQGDNYLSDEAQNELMGISRTAWSSGRRQEKAYANLTLEEKARTIDLEAKQRSQMIEWVAGVNSQEDQDRTCAALRSKDEMNPQNPLGPILGRICGTKFSLEAKELFLRQNRTAAQHNEIFRMKLAAELGEGSTSDQMKMLNKFTIDWIAAKRGGVDNATNRLDAWKSYHASIAKPETLSRSSRLRVQQNLQNAQQKARKARRVAIKSLGEWSFQKGTVSKTEPHTRSRDKYYNSKTRQSKTVAEFNQLKADIEADYADELDAAHRASREQMYGLGFSVGSSESSESSESYLDRKLGQPQGGPPGGGPPGGLKTRLYPEDVKVF
jgi:hypothetical protein